MSSTVTLVEERDAAAWERLTDEFAASPFLAGRWLDALATPRRRPLRLRIVRGGHTVGVLGGLEVDSETWGLRRFGRRWFFYSGPAVRDGDAHLIPEILDAAVRLAQSRGLASVDVRSWDFPQDFALPPSMHYSYRRREFLVDLERDAAVIDRAMRRTVLEQVRQARRAGLAVAIERTPETVDALVDLLATTRDQRLARGRGEFDSFYMPFLGRRALAAAVASGVAVMHCVRREQELLSAMLTLFEHGRAYALLIGTSAEGYRHKAPTLLMHQCVHALRAEGVRYLNLGGVPDGPDGQGIAFFKKSLGAQERTCLRTSTRLMRRTPLHLLARALQREG